MSAEWGLTPTVDDPETSGFFAAAAEGRLVAQRCSACRTWQHPPRPRCRECQTVAPGWEDLPQTGSVHTWTVVEHQISPSFPVPYTVVLVDVVADVGSPPLRFLGHLPGRPALTIGTPVNAVFREHGGAHLPDWELAAPAAD